MAAWKVLLTARQCESRDVSTCFVTIGTHALASQSTVKQPQLRVPVICQSKEKFALFPKVISIPSLTKRAVTVNIDLVVSGDENKSPRRVMAHLNSTFDEEGIELESRIHRQEGRLTRMVVDIDPLWISSDRSFVEISDPETHKSFGKIPVYTEASEKVRAQPASAGN